MEANRPDISVAVVEAATAGNIGTIARSMKNFGVEELLLVDPPHIGPGSEAYGFAGRARDDILPAAREITFDELVSRYHTVGFTSTANPTDTKGIRNPVFEAAEVPEQLASVDARTALVFGRERIGLTNEELSRLDMLATIPANPDYPVLNLGQAATIALYECRDVTLSNTQVRTEEIDRADEQEIEALYTHIDEFLDTIHYQSERRTKAGVMFRRLLGRAHPTSREVSTLHGILRSAEYQLRIRKDEP